MARATKADKTRLLSAAFRLLEQQMERAEAAQQLGRDIALSRRQAYHYLQKPAGLSAPVPAVEPTFAITFKLPVGTLRAIRLRPDAADFPLGQVVAQAVTAFLDTFRQPRG